jgi:hypothetical protein
LLLWGSAFAFMLAITGHPPYIKRKNSKPPHQNAITHILYSPVKTT